MRVPFTYYLHDDYNSAERIDMLRSQGVEIDETLAEKMGRPFYEVTLHCELDTETGAVTVLETKL